MNKVELLADCPRGADWLHQDIERKQEWALRLIHRALGQFEPDIREPDAWEAAELNGAIGAFLCGQLALAVTYVAKAATPVHERGAHNFGNTPALPLRALLNGYATLTGGMSFTFFDRGLAPNFFE